MAQQETLALVAVAVDKATGPLNQVGKAIANLKKEADGLGVHSKQLEAFGKQLVQLGRQIGGDVPKHRKNVEEYGKQWKEFGRVIGDVGGDITKEMIPSLGKLNFASIASAGSIGLLTAAVVKFGESQHEIFNLSKVTGMDPKTIDTMTSAYKRLGVTAEEYHASLQQSAQKYRQLLRPDGGQLGQSLSRAGELKTLDEMRAIERSRLSIRDKNLALSEKEVELARRLRKESPAGEDESQVRARLEERGISAINAARSRLTKEEDDAQQKRIAAARNFGAINEHAIEEQINALEDLSDAYAGVQNAVLSHLVPGLTVASKALADFLVVNREEITLGITGAFKGLYDTIMLVKPVLEAIDSWLPKDLSDKLKKPQSEAAQKPIWSQEYGQEVDKKINERHQWWRQKVGLDPTTPAASPVAPPIPTDQLKRDSRGRVLPDQNTPQQYAGELDLTNTPMLGGPGAEGEYGRPFKPNPGADNNFGLGLGGLSENVDDRRAEDSNTSATKDNTAELKKITDEMRLRGPMTGGIASQLGVPGGVGGGGGGGASSGGGGGSSGGTRSGGGPPSVPNAPLDPKNPNSYNWPKPTGGGPEQPSVPGTAPIVPLKPDEWGTPRAPGGVPQSVVGTANVPVPSPDPRGRGGATAAGKGAGFGGRPGFGSTGDTNPNTAEPMPGNGDNVAVSQAVTNQPQTAAMRAVDRMLMLEGAHERTPGGRALIQKFLQYGGGDQSGMNPAETAWCAATVNSALAQEGIRGSGSAVANSFANYGTRVAPGDVRKGDILNAMHGKPAGSTGGHVGVATGNVDPETGKIEMFSGNTTGPDTGGKSLIAGRNWYDPKTLNIRRPPEPTDQAMAPFDPGAAVQTQVAGAGGGPRPGDANPNAAAVRNNNPGAMAYAKWEQAYGAQSKSAAGFSISQFPTPVHGGAANIALMQRKYVGWKIGDVMRDWSGGSRGTPTGRKDDPYDPNQVVTKEMVEDPAWATKFMQDVAKGETPGNYPMDQAQWNQAHGFAMAGGVPQDAQIAQRGDDPNSPAYAFTGRGKLSGAVPYQDMPNVTGPSTGAWPRGIPGGFETTAGPVPRFAVRANIGGFPPQSEIKIPDQKPDEALERAAGKNLGVRPDESLDTAAGKQLGALPAGSVSAANEMTHKVEGSGSIKVDVSAPKGTKVTGESDGLFKQVEVNRTAPMTESTQQE